MKKVQRVEVQFTPVEMAELGHLLFGLNVSLGVLPMPQVMVPVANGFVGQPVKFRSPLCMSPEPQNERYRTATLFPETNVERK